MAKKLSQILIFEKGQGASPLTPEIVEEWFDLDDAGSTVVWRKARGRKIRPGQPAGMQRVSNNPEEGFLGTLIGFNGELLKAEEVAWTLEHGEFPKGEIIHKDGNRLNNDPTNLFEVGAPKPEVLEFLENAND